MYTEWCIPLNLNLNHLNRNRNLLLLSFDQFEFRISASSCLGLLHVTTLSPVVTTFVTGILTKMLGKMRFVTTSRLLTPVCHPLLSTLNHSCLPAQVAASRFATVTVSPSTFPIPLLRVFESSSVVSHIAQFGNVLTCFQRRAGGVHRQAQCPSGFDNAPAAETLMALLAENVVVPRPKVPALTVVVPEYVFAPRSAVPLAARVPSV
jgi:hypothetical protein